MTRVLISTENRPGGDAAAIDACAASLNVTPLGKDAAFAMWWRGGDSGTEKAVGYGGKSQLA